jgi:hypothetical protein
MYSEGFQNFELPGRISNAIELETLILNLSEFSNAAIKVKYSEIIPVLREVFNSRLHLLDYQDIIADGKKIFSKLRIATGTQIPDKLETDDYAPFDFFGSSSSYEKNAGGSGNPPRWFHDWFGHEFPGEMDFVASLNYESEGLNV